MNELEQIISIMEQFQKEQQQMKNDINNLYNTVKNSLIMQKNSTTDMNERVLPALKLMIDGLGNNLKYEIADYITHNNHLFFQKSNLIKQPLIILLMKANHLQDSEMANLV